MGASISRWWTKMEARILLLGLDAAGKTTILFYMKLGAVLTTIPTIGFNVETIKHKRLTFTAWDVGGGDKIRPLYRHYFANTDAIVWVVDSNDTERMTEVREELLRTLTEDQMRDVCVLIIANKQDLPNAQSPTAIAEMLTLHKIIQDYRIIPAVATTGEGLAESIEWLHDTITKKKYGCHINTKDARNDLDGASSKDDAVSLSKLWNISAWELLKSLFVANSG